MLNTLVGGTISEREDLIHRSSLAHADVMIILKMDRLLLTEEIKVYIEQNPDCAGEQTKEMPRELLAVVEDADAKTKALTPSSKLKARKERDSSDDERDSEVRMRQPPKAKQ